MDGDASFGHWLALRRKALRLSCVELARRVGCATVTLHKIEADERRPSEQTAAKLADHLALPPAERATFIRVARGEIRVDWLPPPDELATGTPRTAPAARPSNVPIPPTPLVGRAADVAAVREMLLRGDVRLLTLSGAPGIGKTRLSLQVAMELRDAPSTLQLSSGQAGSGHAFADGVYFIPLAPLGDPGLVIATIAQTLGVVERAGQSVRERLSAELREKQLLLVLDNFEHVLSAAPQLAELLAAAPRLTLLITSRVALRLVGEQRYAVPPLAVPLLPKDEGGTMKDEDRPASDTFHPSSFIVYSSVELFVQRARAVLPAFALTAANAPAIASICRRLDGLPLAIELAARRSNLFTPQELFARLEQRFALLTAGALDMPTRQQTLRRAIDWSYDLLDEAEQRLFRRLGVFMGGCTIEAAEFINEERRTMNDEGAESPNSSSSFIVHPSSLDLLAALVDKSLLQREDGRDGHSRFTMLETIREYARERLAEAGELERAQQRHLAYELALAEAAEPLLSTSDQRVWLDRLEQDHDDLRTALAWAVDHDPEGALRLSAALADFWLTRGHLSQGRQWIERALASADARAHGGADPNRSAGASPPATAVRAKALHGAGKIAHVQEDSIRAEELFAQGLTLARALGDSHRTALLLNDMAEQALQRGEAAQAAALCAEGLAFARAADDRAAVAHLLLGLGDVVWAQGEVGYAATCYHESLAIGRALDDRPRIAWALLRLGQLALARGEMQRAADAFAEGLTLAREVGDQEALLYRSPVASAARSGGRCGAIRGERTALTCARGGHRRRGQPRRSRGCEVSRAGADPSRAAARRS